GHGVTLLSAPQLVSDVVKGGPFAQMAGELARFVADPGRVGIVVVTQAEEMPVEEALELRRALHDRLGRAPEALVVNGLYPRLDGGAGEQDNELVSLWRRRRQLNERE